MCQIYICVKKSLIALKIGKRGLCRLCKRLAVFTFLAPSVDRDFSGIIVFRPPKKWFSKVCLSVCLSMINISNEHNKIEVTIETCIFIGAHMLKNRVKMLHRVMSKVAENSIFRSFFEIFSKVPRTIFLNFPCLAIRFCSWKKNKENWITPNNEKLKQWKKAYLTGQCKRCKFIFCNPIK